MVLVVRKNNWLLEYQGGLVLGNIVMLVAWFCEGNNKKTWFPIVRYKWIAVLIVTVETTTTARYIEKLVIGRLRGLESIVLFH